MATFTVKTKRIGGSTMVRIPKNVVEEESIQPNQPLRITVEKPKLSGFGLLKGIKIEKEHIKASDFD
ncbi:MAG: hypothetical protein Q7S21_02990 [archaeon]|nr:hypothetical protein [archaeon]